MDFVEIADNEHCVYLLWATVNERACVKIGYTSFLGQRIIQVCQGVPFDMKSAWVVRARNRYHAAELELQFHKRFAAKRTRGEWFMFDSEDEVMRELDLATAAACAVQGLSRSLIDVAAMADFYRGQVNSARKRRAASRPKRKTALDQRIEAGNAQFAARINARIERADGLERLARRVDK